MGIRAAIIKDLASACGFELAGIAATLPVEDFARFDAWRARGLAGEMNYLTDRRGDLRADPRHLLPQAQSMICVGKLYNTSYPYSDGSGEGGRGWISRYAWGADYHEVMRENLSELVRRIIDAHGETFSWRICVDTAPLLERSYARLAGLGWIGRNTCLINQTHGSWFFLGEILLSIPLEPDSPPPDRCGTCTRCIDACPTEAIIPGPADGWLIDARLCISYLTIEKRGPVSPTLAAQTGHHLFGCDICQEVCPWNRRAPTTDDASFAPQRFAPLLESLADLTEEDFRTAFRLTPVWRAKYSGFLRNVASAMGNSGRPEMLAPLGRLLRHSDPVIASAAEQAIVELRKTISS